MTMRSTNLLPALRELPTSESRQRMSFRDTMTGLVGTDRAMYAAEFTSAVSVSLWALFHRVNVEDTLATAYQAQYPNDSASQSLYEQWQEMMERGPESVPGIYQWAEGQGRGVPYQRPAGG